MEKEKPNLFKNGDLVVVSIEKGFKGYELSILRGGKKLYMDDNEYLIGQVISGHYNLAKLGRTNFLLVLLTVRGIVSISKFSFLGSDSNRCLEVNGLTPVIGDWLTENCDYSNEEGKWRLKKGLLAVTSFSEFIGQLPQEGKR